MSWLIWKSEYLHQSNKKQKLVKFVDIGKQFSHIQLLFSSKFNFTSSSLLLVNSFRWDYYPIWLFVIFRRQPYIFTQSIIKATTITANDGRSVEWSTCDGNVQSTTIAINSLRLKGTFTCTKSTFNTIFVNFDSRFYLLNKTAFEACIFDWKDHGLQNDHESV